MNAHRYVELLLRVHFDATADRTIADGQVESILAATSSHRQQPAWLASLRSLPMSTTARSLGRPISAPAGALLLILGLLIAIAAAGLTVGQWRLFTAPIENGPIVFGRFDPSVDDTVIHIARPDGSDMRVLLPGANECPQFSPDGRRLSIGFGTVAVDGTDRREFTNPLPDGSLGCSTWSPDGTRLAVEGFSDADPSFNGIFLADSSDGSDVTRLTTNGDGGNDIPGDFSPDGRHLSYLHGVGENIATLWVVEVATGVARQVVTTQVDYGPTWSPDGDWILVDGGDHFLVVRPDGTDGHTLRVPAEVGWVGEPQHSPDGTRILFHMAVKGSDKNDIYTMKVDGTDLVQITATPNDNEYFTDWGIEPR
jgi:WD40-like Beta Propeller Repeat